ncbi:MAG: hypothetical protein KDJ47_02605 [Hyphomicrobiaceae bacterium]|nr:hypothetical protein [Hyphomicrobiaceae bacterium]
MSKPIPTRVLAQRILELDQWLEAEAPYARFDQCHLDAETPERAYWHLGYQAALIDVLARINGDTEGSADTASHSPEADLDG